jgi:hypothetical protein
LVEALLVLLTADLVRIVVPVPIQQRCNEKLKMRTHE